MEDLKQRGYVVHIEEYILDVIFTYHYFLGLNDESGTYGNGQ